MLMHKDVNRKKKKTFWRYIFSYLFIFLIPFTLFQFVFQIYFSPVYQREVEDNLRQASDKIGQNIDWQIGQINNLITQVRLSDQFGAAYAEDPIHQIEMRDQLQMLLSGNNLLFAINYYQKNLSVVISSRCVMQRSTIDRFHFSYLNWDLEDMLSDLDALSTIEYRPFEPMLSLNKSCVEVMTINVPLSPANYYNAQVLQIQIKKEDFEQAIGLSGGEAGLFIIVDKDGRAIYSSDQVTESCMELAQELSLQGSESAGSCDGFQVFGTPSGFNNWYYVTLLPLDEAMSKTETLKMVLVIYSGVQLLLCVLVIYWVSKRNYRPIQQLNELSQQYVPSSYQGNRLDEIERAKMAISYLHEFSYRMQTRLEKSSTQIQEGLIRRLLQGEYRSLTEFNEAGAPYQVTFNSPFLFVAAASSSGDFTPEVIQKVERHLSMPCEAYGVQLFQAAHAVFVCGIENCAQEHIMQIFQDLSNSLLEEGLELRFGLSTPTSDPSGLYSKYVEAVSSLGYLQRDKPVMMYSGGSASYGFRYPAEEVETLRRFAMEKDAARFQTVYQAILSYIENLKVSIFLRICVCYDVINAMIKIVIELQGDAAAQNILSQNALASGLKSGDINEYVTLIKELRDQICANLEAQEPRDMLLEQIKAYIMQHYKEADFSVQCVADRFQMSLPNMSAYFKNKTDVTLIQYITEYKMGYAMELLSKTDLSLAVISAKIGYSTPSSFIRKFKQYTGMTPGEYKRVHEAGESSFEDRNL